LRSPVRDAVTHIFDSFDDEQYEFIS